MTLASISQVLQACMSSDNAQRSAAENNLTASIEQNPQQSLLLLAEALANGAAEIRGLAAVILRKKLVQDGSKFQKIDDGSKKQVMDLLLKRLSEENDANTRKKVGDLSVEIATALEGRWGDLNTTLLQLVQKDGANQTTALYILGELAQYLTMDHNALQELIKVAAGKFSHSDRETTMEALKMFGKCICAMPAKKIPSFREAVPSMLQLLTKLLQDGDEDNAQKLLQVLIEIAQTSALFYRIRIDDVVKMCTEIGSQANFEGTTKSLGLEVLCTIIENEPGMVRKNKNFIDKTVELSLKMMLDIEDDPEWNKTYDASVEDDENFDAGQVALNRLSEQLNAKKFLPALMPNLTKLLQNQQRWQMRHAAFIAMAQCCELFHQNKTDKTELLKEVTKGVNDPHHRVRYAAIHCLGIMCSDFGKKFVNKHSSHILDLFEKAMADSANPRLQAHAAICVVNYAEKVSSKLLAPRLGQLLQKLFHLLSCNQKFVQENVLSAVSECAENAQEQFQKYYADFTKALMSILQNATQEGYVSLRLEALRCLTYIGVAVGWETFKDHAIQAMQISLPIIQQDGVEVVRILHSWRRIFETCKEDMAPFIEKVAEVAFKYASQNVKMDNWESDDEDVEVNSREHPVNASRVEETSSAINLLYVLTKYSGGKAWPIVEKAAEIGLPLIDNPVDDSIQEAAAEMLPGLLKCLVDAAANNMGSVNNNMVTGLFNMILTKVVGQMPMEESPDSLCSFSLCIEKCIKTNEQLTRTLNDDMIRKLYAACLTCLKESAERMDVRNELMKEPDKDEEDIDTLKEQNEQEATLSTNISDAVGAMIQVYRDDFLKVLQTEYQTLNAMLSDDALDIQKRAALYIFCDVVDHCSVQVLSTQLQFFVGHFKKAAQNPKDECVRQAGIFALGLLFQKTEGKVSAALDCNEILKLCFAQFSEPAYQEGEIEDVQDNAALTIGRICKFCPDKVNLNEVYPQWLNCFPVRNDEDASTWCYVEIVRQVNAGNQAILGPNLKNVPKILHWIAEVAWTDMSNEELDSALITLLNKLKGNDAVMKGLQEELPQYLLEKVQSRL